jgi:hypothetical protein
VPQVYLLEVGLAALVSYGRFFPVNELVLVWCALDLHKSCRLVSPESFVGGLCFCGIDSHCLFLLCSLAVCHAGLWLRLVSMVILDLSWIVLYLLSSTGAEVWLCCWNISFVAVAVLHEWWGMW